MTGLLFLVPVKPLEIPYRYPNIEGQHITLISGDNNSKWTKLIGKPISVGLRKECWNDRIQAMSVILPPDLPTQNMHPHIVISWVDDCMPIEANLMLHKRHKAKLIEQQTLDCYVDFLEWNSPITREAWQSRVPKVCARDGCKTLTRSRSDYCRVHRPGYSVRSKY